ncbi:helix-turn-helix domain-containing protein [Streptomyces sp. NPDC048337]|uniref:helix-turn-helix domain-containing protein n=1 Tax=Streptomyces sp. NPDC048337 TaxID=3365535 RepID=UPI0037198830
MIGNHLLQNPRLTLTARGLGGYIQSLPPGTRIGIKDLARRLPEGEARIASALRELEAHGYLRRIKEQLPDGRIVTRTVSYNHPKAATEGRPASPPPPPPQSEPPAPEPVAEPAPEPEPEPVPEPWPAGPPGPPAPPSPGRRAAVALLGGLRRTDPRLLLGERDIERLAGGVEAWLDRGATFDAVTAVLTARVPDPVRNPAGLIAHRLAAQLPPELEPLFRRAAFVPPDPFQTCDTCDRAFRSPAPGRCADCTDAKGAFRLS